jgi:hypothetical protein
MKKFCDLYEFIDFAKSNRKYPENTANGLKSALKIFEKELNIDELNSVDLVEDNIEEIFINVVSKNKNKGIGSLNTYKGRLLKVINDYQKYGVNPSKIQGWTTKINKITSHNIGKKDTSDKEQDKIQTVLSDHTNTPVHKIELSLQDDRKSTILIPKDITAKEAKMIKDILDSLTIE